MKINYTTNWLLQKIFAISFLILLIYVIFSFYKINLSDYSEILMWFSNFWNSTIFFILFTCILLHSNIGLNSIVDDYVHHKRNKKLILILKNSCLITMFIIVIMSLYTLY